MEGVDEYQQRQQQGEDGVDYDSAHFFVRAWPRVEPIVCLECRYAPKP